jgi:hypothetical protein
MRKVIIYCILIVSLIACNKTNDNKTNNKVQVVCESSIDSIKAFYYNYQYFMPTKGISYSDIIKKKRPTFIKIYIGNTGNYEIKYRGVMDTLITNCDVLLSIESELENLKPDTSFAAKDVRIAFVLYFKNSKSTKIILINDFNDLFFNDSHQAKNNKLIYLIKRNIGFYSWFTQSKLKDMQELNDTTFEREPNLMSAENNPRLIGVKNIFH